MKMDYPSSEDDAGLAEDGDEDSIVPASAPSPAAPPVVKGKVEVETQDVLD